MRIYLRIHINTYTNIMHTGRVWAHRGVPPSPLRTVVACVVGASPWSGLLRRRSFLRLPCRLSSPSSSVVVAVWVRIVTAALGLAAIIDGRRGFRSALGHAPLRPDETHFGKFLLQYGALRVVLKFWRSSCVTPSGGRDFESCGFPAALALALARLDMFGGLFVDCLVFGQFLFNVTAGALRGVLKLWRSSSVTPSGGRDFGSYCLLAALVLATWLGSASS